MSMSFTFRISQAPCSEFSMQERKSYFYYEGDEIFGLKASIAYFISSPLLILDSFSSSTVSETYSDSIFMTSLITSIMPKHSESRCLKWFFKIYKNLQTESSVIWFRTYFGFGTYELVSQGTFGIE